MGLRNWIANLFSTGYEVEPDVEYADDPETCDRCDKPYHYLGQAPICLTCDQPGDYQRRGRTLRDGTVAPPMLDEEDGV